jgi:hypothetical protein
VRLTLCAHGALVNRGRGEPILPLLNVNIQPMIGAIAFELSPLRR